MKIIRCRPSLEDTRISEPCYAVLEGDSIRILKDNPYGDQVFTGTSMALEEVHLLPPCLPGKIVAVGFNYVPHVREMQTKVPPEPLIFLKPPSAVIGPEEQIILPPMSSRVEFEGELAVVIGRSAKNVEPTQALDYVFGYTCFNDVTARDLQKKDVQFTRAKGFDTFAPLGPHIETDLDPGNLKLTAVLNAEVRQRTNTSSLIRSVPELLSYISRIMTLFPGDIIATGTPSGVAQLHRGDVISIQIEGIGTLTNRVDS